MSTIVTCECGAKIRLPERAEHRAFRCPQCKSNILTTADSEIITTSIASADQLGRVCPICQSAIQSTESVVVCPDCEQVHHDECWAEVGGCSTYGCKQAPSPTKEASPASPPLAAWGDTKTCPACGETIKSIALRCRYCGSDFDTVDPLTVGDLRRQASQEESLRKLRYSVIAYFAVSLIGCLAPIMAIIGLAWVLPNRKRLAKSGPVNLVLGYSALALSVLYSVLLVAFWLLTE